jgi:pyruvate kinase
LALQVDETWLAARRVGDEISTVDARGPKRTFTVTEVSDGGVLAENRRHNTYLADGAKLTWEGSSTAVEGILPVARKLFMVAGDHLVLTPELTPVEPPSIGQVARIGCTMPEAIVALRPGDPVLFDDGTVTAAVETVTGGEATLRVTRTKPGGQHLGAQKGINVPDTVLAVNALTDDDDAQLPFIAQHADIVVVSFIRTADDVAHVIERMDAAGAGELGLVLKIETRQGFENLPAILLVAMRHPDLAVMVARGDLAVEIGFERLAEVPRQILALCEAAHVPAIWATQVLESLAQTGQPSRAEITDAAAGQRAECVMLNKGPHIAEAIRTLDGILARMGEVQRKGRTLMRHIHSWDDR